MQMFIGSEGFHIYSAVRLGSRWSPLWQCYCVNVHVSGHTFINNMNIFLDITQLHLIQWIYLINPIIAFQWGFLYPLVSPFLTEIGVFVPGCQAASLRGWSPSQGDCYDHVVFVPTSGCGREIGSGKERNIEAKNVSTPNITCTKKRTYTVLKHVLIRLYAPINS